MKHSRTTLMSDEQSEESKVIPYVNMFQMTREVRDHIARNPEIDYLWTDDWSPEFYRAQARLGFIAIAHPHSDGHANLLLPQLQFAYAVLDWPDLVIDRGVRKILDSGRVDRGEIRLDIDDDPGPVLAGLEKVWADRTWLLPEYLQLARQLASVGERKADPGFRLFGTTLCCDGEPVAGELGYAVGRVYVSLSGYLRREERKWNHFGKLQMVLLARRLEASGFAWWNLGHPSLPYKTRLGAKIIPREEFLQRWDEASAEEMGQTLSNNPRFG